MNQPALIILICLLGLSMTSVYSQNGTPQPELKNKEFEILLPPYKIPRSRYNSIDCIDTRFDRTNLGIVQLGAFNQQAQVILQSPFSDQLQKVMQAITDSTAREGKLLLQFRKFAFSEVTSMASETGYCYLNAYLYAKQDARYQMLATIDTLLTIRKLDVTKALLKEESKIITDFIGDNLLKEAHDPRLYSLREISQIDSTEKRAIALYNVEKYAEGLYYNYESFSKQIPDRQIFVETKKDGKIKCVNINGQGNLLIKVMPQDVYAIVYNGQPYIATPYGYYAATKMKDDLYFTGKIKLAASSEDRMAVGMMFGVAGMLLVSSSKATYEMKLDHRNGSFILLNKIGEASAF